MIIDSSAWIEYFMGTEAGTRVRRWVDGKEMLYTSPIILAEVYSKSVRVDGADRAQERVDFILDRCALIPLDAEIGQKAGEIHVEGKQKNKDFGLADAFALASANTRGLRVLTQDKHILMYPEGVKI